MSLMFDWFLFCKIGSQSICLDRADENSHYGLLIYRVYALL